MLVDKVFSDVGTSLRGESRICRVPPCILNPRPPQVLCLALPAFEEDNLSDVLRILKDFESAVLLVMKNAQRLGLFIPRAFPGADWLRTLSRLLEGLNRRGFRAYTSGPDASKAETIRTQQQVKALTTRLFGLGHRVMVQAAQHQGTTTPESSGRYFDRDGEGQGYHPKDDVQPKRGAGRKPRGQWKKAQRKKEFLRVKKQEKKVENLAKALEQAQTQLAALKLSRGERPTQAEDGGGGGLGGE